MRLIGKITVATGMVVAVTVALALLKLAKIGMVAGWSWWTVASPLWGTWGLIAFFVVMLLCGVAGERGLRKLESWARG